MSATRQLCTFLVDGLLLGVDVRMVQEVIRSHALTRVPLAPRMVKGLLNLRGQIVPAIDMRTRLGLPERAEDPMIVVVCTDEGAVSLLVDEIGDVVDVPVDTIGPPPDTLRGAARDLVESVCRLNPGLLLTLRIHRAVDVQAALQ